MSASKPPASPLPPEAPSGSTAIDAIPSYSNATLDKDKPVDPKSPRCLGCGRYHGSVNVELNCLRAAIAKLREGK